METRANHLLIGTAALLFVAAVAGFVLWLGQAGVGEEQQRYLVRFEGSVAGLKEGASVRFSGVEVGSVTRVRLAPDQPGEALVTIAVRADTPVRQDSEASIGLSGIAGQSHLTISGGSPEAPLLNAEADGEPPVIEGRPSEISRLIDVLPQIAGDLNTLTDQITDLLGEQQRQDVKKTVANLRKITDEIARRDAAIGRILDDLGRTAQSLDRAAQKAEALMDRSTETIQAARATFEDVDALLEQDVEPMVQDGERAAAALASLADEMEQMVAENRQPIREMTSEGFLEIRHFINEARLLVDDLSVVAERLKERPAEVLFNEEGGEFRPEVSQ